MTDLAHLAFGTTYERYLLAQIETNDQRAKRWEQGLRLCCRCQRPIASEAIAEPCNDGGLMHQKCYRRGRDYLEKGLHRDV